MTRHASETLCLLALLCVAACGSGSNERCAECGRDAGSSGPAGADASPADARIVEESSTDAASLDATVVDADVSADSAPPEPDAGDMTDAADLDAALIECRVEADCVLPPALLACERCQDGSSACPEVHCVAGFCATLIATPCAERRPSETCTRDGDCVQPECKLLCQGDGRSACMPSRCRAGVCVPSYGTCGLSLEPCPEGNQAGRECGECQEDGGCGFQVIGCFESCDAGAACPGGEACVGGLCQLNSCTAAR